MLNYARAILIDRTNTRTNLLPVSYDADMQVIFIGARCAHMRAHSFQHTHRFEKSNELFVEWCWRWMKGAVNPWRRSCVFFGPLMGEVDLENHPTSGHENWGIGIHPFSDTLKHYAMLYTHIHKLAYININMNTYIYNHIYIDKYDTFSDIRTVILVYSIKYPF